MSRHLSLRQRVGILIAIIATVMSSGMATSLVVMWQVHGALNDQLDTYDPSAIVARNLLAAGVGQESAVQGFVLSGNEQFLTTYDENVADAHTAIERLHELLDGQQDLRSKVTDVEHLLDSWRNDFAEPRIEAVRSGRAGHAVAETDVARTRFEAFRDTYEELRAAISEKRTTKRAELERSEDRLTALLVTATMIFVALGVAVWVLLKRWVTAPVEQLGSDVRAVARGELDHHIRTWGPPEIERLGSDVEEMRKRIIGDLKEVELAREQLNSQTEELARSNADLEQFAYVASHDLQEPLRKVASFCQLIEQRYADKLDDTGRQYIEFAVDGAKRMQQLINDLLSFSRVGRNVVDEQVELDDVVGHVVGTFEGLLSETGATVEHADLPVVNGDPTLMIALFQNLLGNAIKFRSPAQAPRVVISAVRRDDWWEMSVADNGIGIESQYAEKIFVIFQRLHGRDEFDGTGIGLSLCKKIVEYHGGQIWLDTEVSSGTTIRFTLPVDSKGKQR